MSSSSCSRTTRRARSRAIPTRRRSTRSRTATRRSRTTTPWPTRACRTTSRSSRARPTGSRATAPTASSARAASPTRSRPPARPGRRTPRISRTRGSPAARPAATRRSTTRSSTSATSPARGRAATASSRSPGSRRDLARHRLPDFSLVVPNLCDDMHDCSVATGDAWLKAHVVPLLHSPELRGGVVFVVFDEGTSDTGGGGRVEALALGPTVRRGSKFAQGDEPLRPAAHDRGRVEAAAARLLAHRDADRRASGRSRSPGARAESVPGMLVSIARALEERDQTLGHGARVAALAEPVALRAGLGSRADPLPSPGRAAARRRQGQDPAAAARQVRAAHARRGRGDPAPPGRRRAARAAAAAIPRRAPVRPLPPRALGRRRLPRGAERTQDPDRGPDPRDRRRLRRDDLRRGPYRRRADARRTRSPRCEDAAPARSSTRSRRSSSSRPGPRAGTPGSAPSCRAARAPPRPRASRGRARSPRP